VFIPRRREALACAILLWALAFSADAHAYIGPGAGFAILSSFFVLLTTLAIVALSLLAWPFRALWRAAIAKRAGPSAVGRLVIVGFDGQDPALTDRFMREGRLPNFTRLAELGAYRRLRTTCPSVSPVAWSSFSTGCQPGRHNIFDFIEPDRRTYLPRLTSVHVGRVERFFQIGPYRVPRGKPELRLLRKSRAFWSILGEHRIWSTILRVPVTFPPERFYGAQLSAMCVPDLLGTQGTFLLFTTRPPGQNFTDGGLRIAVPAGQDRFTLSIPGPENAFRVGTPELSAPCQVEIRRQEQRARVTIDGRAIDLAEGVLSDWIRIRFRAAPGVSLCGVTRMLVLEVGEHFSLYLAPLNLDPERPAMPISHPRFYATYLAKRLGAYATLGLAEDTWARNEGVIDDKVFLRQSYDIDREREQMLMAALERRRRGAVVCVFDATDRIQHMFWRQMENGDPAIRELYERNDAMVGRLLERLQKEDVLMVISDHGFSAFRRGLNLSSWLLREGYLVLKAGADGRAEWLRDVDWGRTRAYCLGLTGLFLNLAGREQQGIVGAGEEAAALKAELASRLNGLRDPETGDVAIRELFDSSAIYAGPYVANAPDFLIGYNAGYRISWAGAMGVVAGPVFEDNLKPWSGDHCVDPRLVPGVFFCNRPVETEDPALVDIAPTVLRLFGIEPPGYMDGRPLAGLA
jgi:predicted AlkP superfamily phosphohydrolase/phosphomutase